MRSTRPVRIGVQIQPQHADYPAIRDAVARAEDAGVDVAFTWDHFFPLAGDPDGKHFEAWTVLSAWAEQTRRVELGVLVTCNSYRNPDLLADMARTVDHISGGRAVLGIGAGWFERDYTEYGYEFGTPGSRITDLAEAMPRIRRRWAALNPAPTRQIPVLIGGGGERKTLRVVAEHADIWHTFGDVEVLRHKSRVLDDWCTRVGRDPGEIERSVGMGREAGPDAAADALRDAGVTLFTTDVSGPDYDLGLVRRWIAWRDERNADRDERAAGAAPHRSGPVPDLSDSAQRPLDPADDPSDPAPHPSGGVR